MIFTLVADK